MISIIMYGRNDCYGYNLHKRASISLNCISEMLTDTDDEIIFVDCNTPNDMPTFPEAIADTLIPKTRSVLRVLRLRPEVFAKNSKSSPLLVNEPLSRNVGLRRSNKANKWILSTNPDMVFITRPPWNSLSEVAEDLPAGYYGTCRIDLPESLWESMERSEPSRNLSMLARWGQRLHLNEVVYSRNTNIFDGPGDFQLMPREQLFSINGFDERMVLGWHVDSNICIRMHLLFGETNSLLDRVLGYHCCHTRTATFLHTNSVRTMNDTQFFVERVTEPAAQGQDLWGLANTEIEEISLASNHNRSLWQILEDVLPGMSDPYLASCYTLASYDSLDYDTEHLLPHLINYLTTTPATWNIAYYGANLRLLRLLADFLSMWGFGGKILVQEDLLIPEEGSDQNLPALCALVTQEECSEDGDILVFDSGIDHFRKDLNRNSQAECVGRGRAKAWTEKLRDSFVSCAIRESNRINEYPPRKFVLIGAVNSWFEGLTSLCIDHTLTPYCSHIRHGFIKPKLDAKFISRQKNNFAWTGWTFEDALQFAKKHFRADVAGLVPDLYKYRDLPLKQPCYPYEDISEWDDNIRFAIIFKSDLANLKPWLVKRIKQEMRPVYTNDAFVCFSSDPELEYLGRRIPEHIFWWWMNAHPVWRRIRSHVSSVLARHPRSWWARPARLVVNSMRRIHRKSPA